ncbi:probable DNA metabolism protein [Chitinophaga sp. CF118]|uniref:TIGR03915 family putative DNA repair protein n=1 Tax=Chitinophaga sp. CF118 TaxID=1884367 RepID=UPI0008E4A312|nr:TIGR03915 family putative DNA repair protein [Chitinophaga sp. CF118]SFE52972.1 probable DNA metabolism protein [Chitinophaga sp. CF118]
MTTWLYDGTFDGFLSCVFDMYWQRKMNILIRKEQEHVRGVFEDAMFMPTIIANADRVWAGLSKKVSPVQLSQFFACYLSELPAEEDNMVGYLRYVLGNQDGVSPDPANFYIMHAEQLAHKVQKERHRMESLVSFQLTKDNIYYAIISPNYNVLPLMVRHFKEHYADQFWLIYDQRRRFGIYYNLQQVETIRLQFNENYDARYHNLGNIWAPEDELYQQVWKAFYKEDVVKSTNNQRLQLKHMPRRYWKYLGAEN